jgi:hypothetical protein
MHQKDYRLREVWIAQIAAGHQKPADRKIFGLGERWQACAQKECAGNPAQHARHVLF